MTSTWSEMSGALPLRDTDPHEVGAYRLLGRLGEGGQGVVFLAAGPTDRRAAVKLLPPTTNPQVRSRFLKEVAAAQRVGGSCTAQVLDAGIFERRPFIVTEYVSGRSLVEVVERFGPRHGAELDRIAVATLTALAAAHAVGMVHRDFKPGNVLLGPDGPVVIDFGLATVPGMTTTGMSGQVAVGTPVFMAPEQLAGERVTPAADMWSWAVTIAFAGTGQLPFKGESLTATAYAILHSEPVLGPLPEPLGSLVRRCLNKDATARPSARAALTELAGAGARLMGPLPPPAFLRVTDEEEPGPDGAPAAPALPPPSAGEGSAGSPAGRKVAPAERRSHRPWRWWAAAGLGAVLLAVGAVGLALSLPRNGAALPLPVLRHAGTSPPLKAEGVARERAIAWILQQVSRSTVVSCDPQFCTDLAYRGWPSANVLTLGSQPTALLGSDLVVATAAVRDRYGSRLAAVYAPAVIASFGSGNARIDIRRVYPGGATAYRAAQRAALRDRRRTETQLLTNSRITLSAAARTQLRSGDIDPRLPALIAAMAVYKPVRVVDFGGQSPGGGPASLLRSVDLAAGDPAAHLTPTAYLTWLRGFIAAQQAPYRPAWSRPVTLPTGEALLRIGYDAPSPLSPRVTA